MPSNQMSVLPKTPFVAVEALRTPVLRSGQLLPLLPDPLKVKMVTIPSPSATSLYTIPDFPGEEGKVYERATIPPSNNRGLILLCHGAFNAANEEQSVKNDAYKVVLDSLAKCLAGNGFVVASIRHLILGPDDAEKSFLIHLHHILTDRVKFEKYSLHGRPVGFVGVSEGGNGAIRAARKISTGVLSNFDRFLRESES